MIFLIVPLIVLIFVSAVIYKIVKSEKKLQNEIYNDPYYSYLSSLGQANMSINNQFVQQAQAANAAQNSAQAQQVYNPNQGTVIFPYNQPNSGLWNTSITGINSVSQSFDYKYLAEYYIVQSKKSEDLVFFNNKTNLLEYLTKEQYDKKIREDIFQDDFLKKLND